MESRCFTNYLLSDEKPFGLLLTHSRLRGALFDKVDIRFFLICQGKSKCSRWKVFYNKAVFGKFEKFTGKHLF